MLTKKRVTFRDEVFSSLPSITEQRYEEEEASSPKFRTLPFPVSKKYNVGRVGTKEKSEVDEYLLILSPVLNICRVFEGAGDSRETRPYLNRKLGKPMRVLCSVNFLRWEWGTQN